MMDIYVVGTLFVVLQLSSSSSNGEKKYVAYSTMNKLVGQNPNLMLLGSATHTFPFRFTLLIFCSYLAALAGMNAVVKPGGFVPTYAALDV